MKGTKSKGLIITSSGDEGQLDVWTDAGYAGTNTHSQSGLVVTWAGSIIVWRSSRQSVSALSTAEAELYSATLGWQIVEGLRQLITNYGVRIARLRIFIDSQAALTIAKCGANWRTRYFAVRGHQHHEEHARGAIELLHCPTAGMVADALTKLATAPVIEVLHSAMEGLLPQHPSDAPAAGQASRQASDVACGVLPEDLQGTISEWLSADNPHQRQTDGSQIEKTMSCEENAELQLQNTSITPLARHFLISVMRRE